MWADFIKNSVLKPGLQRLGTVAAMILIMGGDWLCATWDMCGLVTPAGAEIVWNYVMAVLLLAFDVILIHVDRIKGKRK